MAFPSIINSANSNTTASSASLVLTMPASIVSGRLLLAFAAATKTTTMTGWTSIGATTPGGLSATMSVFGKIAAGSDTGTVTPSTNSNIAATVYQIDSWSGTIADIGYAGTSSASGSYDPPNLTMLSSSDFLWFSTGAYPGATAASAAPTNYTSLVTSNATSSGSTVLTLGSANRQLTATSENPGTFTGAATNWVAATVAVAPVAAVASLPRPVMVPFRAAVQRSVTF